MPTSQHKYEVQSRNGKGGLIESVMRSRLVRVVCCCFSPGRRYDRDCRQATPKRGHEYRAFSAHPRRNLAIPVVSIRHCLWLDYHCDGGVSCVLGRLQPVQYPELGTCIHFGSARNWPARSREKADKVSPLKLGPTNTRAWWPFQRAVRFACLCLDAERGCRITAQTQLKD